MKFTELFRDVSLRGRLYGEPYHGWHLYDAQEVRYCQCGAFAQWVLAETGEFVCSDECLRAMGLI